MNKKLLRIFSLLLVSTCLFSCGPNETSSLPNYDTINITDLNINNYDTNSIYDNDNQLVVKGIKSDGSYEEIPSKNYTYSVFDSTNRKVNTGVAFATAGTYSTYVKYNNKTYNPISFTVKQAVLPDDFIDIEISDSNINNYYTTSVYKTDNGLSVKGVTSQGTRVTIASTQYTYTIINSKGQMVDVTKAFGEVGNYSVIVNYQNLFSKQLSFVVNTYVPPTPVDEYVDIAISDTNINKYTVNSVYSTDNGLVVMGVKSNGTQERVSDNKWIYQVKNSSQRTVDTTVAFGTAGTYTVNVIYDNKFAKSLTFTVNEAPVPVDEDVDIEVIDTKLTDYTTASIYDTDNGLQVYLLKESGLRLPLTSTDYTYIIKNASKQVIDSSKAFAIAGKYSITVTYNVIFSKTLEFTVVSDTPTPIGSYEYRLVTDESNLVAGDIIVIGCPSEATTAGAIASGQKYMAAKDTTFSNDESKITALNDGSLQFTLAKSGNYWTLTNSDGKKLGAVNNKELSFAGGTTTWNISIDNDKATIANSQSSLGRILYNVSSPRFVNYATTTSTSSTMLLPYIYKKVNTVPIYPTSISMAESSIEVSAVKSTRLSVNFFPQGVNSGMDLTWTSMNTNVATVDNEGLVKAAANAKIGDSTTIKATSLYNSNLVATATVTIVEEQKDKWTIMMYICGANLESYYEQASDDISEILSVSNKPDDINIVIQTGGSDVNNSYFSKSKLRRFEVRNERATEIQSLNSASMGSANTLKDFIVWGDSTYPAEKTALILWNHGGGIYGCCYDELYDNDCLENNEVKTALSGAFTALKRTDKFEFIGYDLCMGANQEMAEFVSPYFNYMVASQESEAGSGYAYNTWIDDVYDYKPTTTILKSICDGFIESVKYDASNVANDQTMSYLDLSYMSEYKTAFEEFAGALKSKLKNRNDLVSLAKTAKVFGSGYYDSKNELLEYEGFDTWTEAQSYGCYYDSNLRYYVSPGWNYFCVFDVKDLVTKIGQSTYSPGSTYVNNLLTALDNLVAYSVKDTKAGNANGLSVFFYTVRWSYDYTSSDSSFTNWIYINEHFGALAEK